MKAKNTKRAPKKTSAGDCSVTNLTKGNPPMGGLPFLAVKNAVLGKKYNLSVVFAPRGMMKNLNRIYRRKDAPTDILSFPLSTAQGEIFINTEEAREEAKKFGRPPENFLAFLIIHGMVHLKGFGHGSRMEAEERKIRARFSI